MKIQIAPSILSANFAALGHDIERLTKAGADIVHIDVMDGHFVPNITIGPAVIKAMRSHTPLPFDVHLMITNPEKYIDDFAKAGANIITIHYESACNLDAALMQIRSLGCMAGISIIPSTPASVIDKFLNKVDLVLVMTVNPGFGGQGFIYDQLAKIESISHKIVQSKKQILLEVDGGINDITAPLVRAAGANVLVAGSFIFGTGDMKENIALLR